MNEARENVTVLQKRNQFAYICEAALEYFVDLLITDSFLATLLSRSGVSDAMTGIITQLSSFAFLAQLAALCFRPRGSVKKGVVALHLLNQMMFVFLYLVPSVAAAGALRTALFVILFLGGHLLSSSVLPFKLSWLMSYVPDNSRGRFTANKEIVSLIGGMIFSYGMGAVCDHFKAIGKDDTAFTFCGITIFVLAVLHTISLLCVKETDEEKEKRLSEKAAPTMPIGQIIRSTFGNKSLMKVVVVVAFYRIATGFALPFYGVYKINELGFSLRYVAFLSILSAIVRVLFSRVFGKYADKHGWASMLNICLIIMGSAFFVNIFAVPANGKYIFALYSILYGASMAGINSGTMNLLFDYVSPEERSSALGVSNAFAGITGFIATLIAGVILGSVQNAGNRFLGVPVYAQQVLSAIAFLLFLAAVVYTRFVVRGLRTVNTDR